MANTFCVAFSFIWFSYLLARVFLNLLKLLWVILFEKMVCTSQYIIVVGNWSNANNAFPLAAYVLINSENSIRVGKEKNSFIYEKTPEEKEVKTSYRLKRKNFIRLSISGFAGDILWLPKILA